MSDLLRAAVFKRTLHHISQLLRLFPLFTFQIIRHRNVQYGEKNVLFHFYFSGFPHAYRPPISFYKAGTTGKLRRMHCTLIYLCICFDIYLLLSSLAEAWLLGLNVSRITTDVVFLLFKKNKTEKY